MDNIQISSSQIEPSTYRDSNKTNWHVFLEIPGYLKSKRFEPRTAIEIEQTL